MFDCDVLSRVPRRLMRGVSSSDRPRLDEQRFACPVRHCSHEPQAMMWSPGLDQRHVLANALANACCLVAQQGGHRHP